MQVGAYFLLDQPYQLQHASTNTTPLPHVSAALRLESIASDQPKYTQSSYTDACQYNAATFLRAVCMPCTSEVNAFDIHSSRFCISLTV